MNDPDLSEIKNSDVKDKVKRGLKYKGDITTLCAKQKESVRAILEQMIGHLDDWMMQMLSLAKLIDNAESNPILVQDRLKLPADVNALKLATNRERNPKKRADLKHELDLKQGLLGQLRLIDDRALQAHKELDEVLMNLEAVYNKVRAIDEMPDKAN